MIAVVFQVSLMMTIYCDFVFITSLAIVIVVLLVMVIFKTTTKKLVAPYSLKALWLSVMAASCGISGHFSSANTTTHQLCECG